MLSSVRTVTITPDYDGQRIDNYLLRELRGLPKSRLYRLLRKGEVRVNKGRIKPDYRLKSGDLLRIPPIDLPEQGEPTPLSANLADVLDERILFEDDNLIIVNKPSGLAVHGGSGINLGLIEAMRQRRPEERHLELVHRLDRDTSGCIMISKRRSTLKILHTLLRDGGIDKRYLALVSGKWPTRKQVVNLPLKKNVLKSGERMVTVDDEGKRSRTEYRVIERLQSATLVEAKPITGRTHQIRVHCLAAGYPILGDEKYGNESANTQFRDYGLRRLFLHAASLSFRLPEGDISVTAPLDDDLNALLKRL